MNTLEKNDFSLLSHIIYMIYNTNDLDQMRVQFLNLVKYIIPFATANFFLVKCDNEEKYSLSSPVNVNSLNNLELQKILEDYMKHCSELDCTHWICEAKKNIAYRTTDYVSEASLESTPYYKQMLLPYNVQYGAQIVLSHQEHCVGLCTLYRLKSDRNFSDNEMFFLDIIKEHLSVKLYKTMFSKVTQENNVNNYEEKYNLTKREGEILKMLLNGLDYCRITEELFITENTLRKHLQNLYAKIGIKSRWQLQFTL